MEPRWLSDAEQQAWLSLVEVVVKLPTLLDAQLQRDAGVTHFEYMVLAMLSGHPEQRLRMSALAAAANASPSRLSHVVKRLEAQGFVLREPSPEDGRAYFAVLTEAGLAKLKESAPGHVDTVRALVIDALSPAHLAAVKEIGDLINAKLDPNNTWPPKN